jgi:predicted regulator of Ras-like GTPase activity (Roadblock/LC7/MglB family)
VPIVNPVAAATHVPTEAVVENGALCLPFSLIATGWPEPVLRDIAQFGLAGARVEIPLASVDAGLKVGRLEFAWRELCAWLNPPSKPAQVSINGELKVTLPLGLIAPLFLKSRIAAQRRKTAVDDDIPNLFSATGTPLPPPPAAELPANPVPVAAPAPAPVAAPAPAPKKAPTNLSELFGEPDKKTWTPNEIVQRTTTLPHVSGAMIALQDGLLVASNMPPGMKTETIAAFVPQIFGRMNQYSKDLQMGETKAVSFTVDAGTVQVFNAGIIYFAAFGKNAAFLPLAELQLIAGELSRHTK